MSRSAKNNPRARREAVTVAVILAVVALAVGLPVGLAVSRSVSAPASDHAFLGQVLPDPSAAYDLKLTDQNGQPFSLSSLKGRAVLLTFGFTHCPNVCPTTLSDLAAAIRVLPPEEQDKVKVVFVTIDPERDTPAALKEYMPFFDKGFIGLTGTPGEIAETAKAYGIFYKKGATDAGGDYMMDHSAYTYLIDPAGRARVLYRLENLSDHAGLTADLRDVLAH